MSSGSPAMPNIWIALVRSSIGWPLRAKPSRISRARGESLCDRTKSARSLSSGDGSDCRNFSSTGTALSGSACIRPLIA